jgi:hypothetical protein
MYVCDIPKLPCRNPKHKLIKLVALTLATIFDLAGTS